MKLDGFRAVVVTGARGVDLFSRRGNQLTGKLAPLAVAFENLPRETVLDGEIVALDDNGRPDFEELQDWSATKPVYFYAWKFWNRSSRASGIL